MRIFFQPFKLKKGLDIVFFIGYYQVKGKGIVVLLVPDRNSLLFLLR